MNRKNDTTFLGLKARNPCSRTYLLFSKVRRFGKNPVTFVKIFKSFFQFIVKQITDLIVDLHC